jgi:hypothetical protein
MIFFTVIGAIVTAGVFAAILGYLYFMFLHPLFQAFSLTNWYLTCLKADGGVNMASLPYWRLVAHYYTVGGWPGERTWNSIGEWYGIGRWRIFPDDEDKAP